MKVNNIDILLGIMIILIGTGLFYFFALIALDGLGIKFNIKFYDFAWYFLFAALIPMTIFVFGMFYEVVIKKTILKK